MNALGQPHTASATRPAVTTLRSRLNSPVGVALITLLLYSMFLIARLHTLDGGLSRFVFAGDRFIPPASAPAGLTVQRDSSGYDGQFYYLLALDPFSPTPALPGASYDLPAYRAQRILYPLLVWALTLGGHAAYIPLALALVNLAAIAAIGWLAALHARHAGLAPLWGLLVALYPGLPLSLARDLPEPLAIALALAALLLIRRHRWGWAALLLSLAILARETTALFALALLAAALAATPLPPRLARFPVARWRAAFRRSLPATGWRGPLLAGLIPLLVAVAWQVVLTLRWGHPGLFAAGGNNIGLPFIGLLEGIVAWRILWSPPLQLAHALMALFLIALIEAARRTLWRQPRLDVTTLAWALSVALTCLLTVYVWDWYWNFLRVAIEVGALSLLILLSARPRLRAAALAGVSAAWLLMALLATTHV